MSATLLCGTALCLALAAGPALAGPEGGVVIEGDATITYGTNTVTIEQNSERVIIEWQSFDVGANESVNFIQPSELAAALNRVLSGEASVILGSLTANGQITLVNPAGIAFGASANIDVAAITATTLDIINTNFMAGDLVFDQYDDRFADASVTNDGTITVGDRGLAALVAPGVANNGIIQARTGAVVLASGTAATIDFYGDGLVNFAVTAPTQAAPVDANGNPLDALVSNSGQIYADGGTVILTAEAVGGIVDNAINMDGVIQARSIQGRDGQIALVGGDGAGAVQVAGTLDASGAEAGTAGGTVHVLGDAVALNAGADIDVSGPAGGGTALVGGSLQGGANVGSGIQYARQDSVTTIIADSGFDAGGYVPTSSIAYVDAAAEIDASATDSGNGGTAVVWADDATAFFGMVAARGGANGGDGGLVEVSGGVLGYAGSVDTSAASGNTGLLLLDPQNIVLGSINPALMAVNIGLDALSGGAFPILVVDQQALANTLFSTDVHLWATNSISTAEDIDISTARNVIIGENVITTGFPCAIIPGGCHIPIFGDAITGNDLSLSAPTVNLYHDVTLGTGALNVVDVAAGTSIIGLGLIAAPVDIEVAELNLDGRIHTRSSVGGGTSLASDAQINTDAGLINVLSNAALINQGVQFAQAGALVTVGDGVYNENVLVDRALTLQGDGSTNTTTLNVGSGTGILVSGTTGGTVSIQGFRILGGGTGQYGILADVTADLDQLLVDDVHIEGFVENGLAVQGSQSTHTASPIDYVGISNAVFIDNGRTAGGSAGRGDLQLFFFNGDADLTNVDITGGGQGRYGIQIRGVDSGVFPNGVQPMGDIAFENVTVDGSYLAPLIGIQGYSEVGNLTFNDVTIGGAGSTSGWATGLYFGTIGSGAFNLGNTSFGELNGGNSLFIQVVGNGGTPTPELIIDATGALFEGTLAGDMSAAELVTLEQRILHWADDTSRGLVNFGAAVVDGGTYANSIQLAVNTAGLINANQVVVGSGTYGGSVEVWVDDLKLTGIATSGGTPVIDGNSVDAYSNFGPAGVGAGLVVADVTGTSGNAPGEDVDGVSVDPFVFSGAGNGIVLGSGASSAVDSIIDGNSFTVTGNGIVLANVGGTTTISNNAIDVGDVGIAASESLSGDTLVVTGNSLIRGNDNGLRFDANVTNAIIQITDNARIEGDGTADFSDAIDFRQQVIDSTVSITGNDEVLGNDDGIQVIEGIRGGSFTIADNGQITGRNGDGINLLSLNDGAGVAISDGAVVSISGNAIEGNADGDTNNPGGGGDGVLISGDVVGAATQVTIDDNSIDAFDDGVHFFGAVSGSTVHIGLNAILALGTGIDFADTIGNNADIDILDNTIGLDGTEVLNGILFQRINAATIDISGGTIDSAAGNNGPIDGDGINFQQGLHSGANVAIAGVTIVSDSDEAIDFHQSIRSGAQAHITGGSYTGGNNGVEFDPIAGLATIDGATIDGTGADKRGVNLLGSITGTLEIADSTITGTDDGIGSNDDQNNTVSGGTFRVTGSTVTGIGGDGIELGDVVNGALVEINDNPLVAGADNGVHFVGTVSGSSIDINGNIIDAGNQVGLNGDGIHFASTVTDSQVRIGSAPGNGNDITVGNAVAGGGTLHDGIYFGGEIGGSTRVLIGWNEIDVLNTTGGAATSFGDMGIRFDGFVNTGVAGHSGIGIVGNTISAGGGQEDRGISFWNGIGGESTVRIADNVIAAGDDGIGVFDTIGGNQNQSLRGNARMVIEGNTIGTSGARVGLANNGDGNGIDFQSVTGASQVVIDDNSIFANMNAIEFDKVVNTTFAGPGAGIEITDNSNINSLREDGIQFAGGVSGSSVLIQGNNAGIFAADHGISFLAAVTNATLNIHDNIIQANLDNDAVGAGIYFGGTVGGTSVVNIGNGGSAPGNQSNIIAVNANAGGSVADNDGILFVNQIAGDVAITIDGNRIGYTAPALAGPLAEQAVGDDAIEFRGGAGGNAEIAIVDNWMLAEDDGVQFTGSVGGSAHILIGANTDGNRIVAGDDGISFLSTLTGEALVDIGYNTINAGSDGILFQGHVNNAQVSPVTEQELYIHHNGIIGDDNGINFAAGISGFRHDTRIAHNSLIQGNGENGIRIAGGINDAEVRILANHEIYGDEDGIDFIGSVTNNALVVIADNDSVTGDDDDAIDFENALNGGSVVNILDNHNIVAGDNGIEFSSINGATVLIAGNNHGIHAENHGIYVGGEVAWSDIDIHDNIIWANTDQGHEGAGIWFDEQIRHSTVNIGDGGRTSGASNIIQVSQAYDDDNEGGLDGIHFDDWIGEGSVITIDGNRIGFYAASLNAPLSPRTIPDDGIEFRGDIRDDAAIVITDNQIKADDDGIRFRGDVEDWATVLIGGWNDGNIISAGDDGIEFSGRITDHAAVEIDRNAIGYYWNGFTLVPYAVGENGIKFGDRINDWAEVDITRNDIRAGDDGIVFFGDTSNVGHGDEDIFIAWNDIVGGENGIHFAGDVEGGAHDVMIAWNHRVEGRDGDGIVFDEGVDGASVRILDNHWIEGSRDGIDFDDLVQDGAFVLIADNFKILGNHDSGIEFSGVVDWNTDVVIDDNSFIVGGNNGIHFGQPDYELTRLAFGGFGGGWSIDQAEVTISDNWLIQGEDENGIWVEGVRGSGFGFDWDNPNLAIVDNHRIQGHDNGILISRVIEGGYDWYADAFTLSGWAVENAEVLIAGNHEIEGKWDDGIQIQGIHSNLPQGGYDGPSDFAAASFGGGWLPATEVTIVGNGEIEGHDNGINLRRGFDLTVWDFSYDGGETFRAAGPGSLVATGWDIDDLGELADLLSDGVSIDLAVSAWAIENADVTIAWNDEIRGRHDDGIFVGGIRAVEQGGFIGDNIALSGYDGGWQPSPSASLVIAHNDLVRGGDNGINLGRGFDFSLGLRTDYENFGYYYPFDVNVELDAWAIDNASVRIVHNDRIVGDDENGIRVAGVRGGNGETNRPTVASIGGSGGFGPDLLIAHNGLIRGEENGIALARGVEFGGFAYAYTFDDSSIYEGYFGLNLSAYAIDNAAVRIVDNHKIEGERDDGIWVGGVRDESVSRSSVALADMPEYDLDRTELAINGNDLIVGRDNGIALDHGYRLYANVGFIYDAEGGYDGGSFLVGEPLAAASGGFGPGFDGFDLGGFDLEGELSIYNLYVEGSAVAIDGAEVEIGHNGAIVGHRDNGILVRGVFDQPEYMDEKRSALTLAGFPASSDWNLDIHDNGWIVGGHNGILIDHGYAGFVGYYEYNDYFGAGFEAWAIADANVRIGNNWLISGLHGDGIQVNGVHGSGVSADRAGAPTSEDDPLEGTVLTDPAQPNLLVEQNTSIIGGRDGIHFGTGFGFEFDNRYDDVGQMSLSNLSTASFGGYDGGFGFGGGYGQSVDGGLVVIDLNGAADYVDGGAPYDPEIPVVLSELDFGDGFAGNLGRVVGIHDDGIDFAGSIDFGSIVQIQRNMITGSGDNGIEFANIGGPLSVDNELIDTLVYDEEEREASYVFVHNNFIVDNGQRLVEEEPGEEIEDQVETLSLAGGYDGYSYGRLTGAGILFEQGLGDQGFAEVFQNYIAGNGGPGIQIGFDPETGSPTSAVATFGRGFGEEGGYDGPISADGLLVIHNYLPGAVDAFDNRPNGGFAIANFADEGQVLAPENWWGTAASQAAVNAQNFGAVDASLFLADGVDSNEERFPGQTGLGPFAFQPGDVASFATPSPDTLAFLAQALILFLARQTHDSQAPGDELGPRPRSDRDADNVFDNVFGDPYAYLTEEGGLASLAPAAGGGNCTLTPVDGGLRLACGGGGSQQQTGEQQDQGGLPNLEPAAGGAAAGPALDPGLSLQDLLNMWLFNFGSGLDTPVADGAAAPATDQASLGTATGTQLAMLR
ncbi:MAG: filamentous hemagglutinin N-terminal domain-containing protein [Alphaproteobacteria bacterium]